MASPQPWHCPHETSPSQRHTKQYLTGIRNPQQLSRVRRLIPKKAPLVGLQASVCSLLCSATENLRSLVVSLHEHTLKLLFSAALPSCRCYALVGEGGKWEPNRRGGLKGNGLRLPELSQESATSMGVFSVRIRGSWQTLAPVLCQNMRSATTCLNIQ